MSVAMALRVFIADGESWSVWETIPRRPLMAREGRAQGWLTFMVGHVKRRYAPVPDGWQDWSDDRLQVLLKQAK